MNYQLHDHQIDSIVLDDNRIVFSFPEGFYVVDENCQELKLSKKKLVFLIDANGSPLESFISIRRINWRKNSWKELSFKQLTALFQKGNMIIYDEFDSKLSNRKILQLNANSRYSNIELIIEDIVAVDCFD